MRCRERFEDFLRRSDWKKLLSFASAIVEKLPTQSDGPLGYFVKSVAIVDSVHEKLYREKVNPIAGFLGALSVQDQYNPHFVDLFFKSSLKDAFTVTRAALDQYTTVVVARNDTCGTLYFLEYRYGAQPEYSHEFWTSVGFSFEVALSTLWSRYEGRIHIGCSTGRHGALKLSFSSIPEPCTRMVGLTDEQAQFLERHGRYLVDQVPRTYLFYGPPGTGKSSLALQLDPPPGCPRKALRIDATGITQMGMADLDLLIDGLNPTLLVVDDVDRANDLAAFLPVLFTILTDFKSKHPSCTICVTVNDSSKLDEALLRPGRIDELVEFPCPSAGARRALLSQYCAEFGVLADPAVLDVLDTPIAGMSPAYLREVALQLKYRTPAEVVQLTTKMHRLVEANKKSAETPGTKKEEKSTWPSQSNPA